MGMLQAVVGLALASRLRLGNKEQESKLTCMDHYDACTSTSNQICHSFNWPLKWATCQHALEGELAECEARQDTWNDYEQSQKQDVYDQIENETGISIGLAQHKRVRANHSVATNRSAAQRSSYSSSDAAAACSKCRADHLTGYDLICKCANALSHIEPMKEQYCILCPSGYQDPNIAC